MALMKCKECGREVSNKADNCPNCGAPQKRKQYGCGSLILIILIIGFIVGTFGSFGKSPSPPPTAKISLAVIQNEKYANPADLNLAKKALADLPSACGDSSINVSKGGTVSLNYLCSNSEKSEKITVKFKNGKVTGLK